MIFNLLVSRLRVPVIEQANIFSNIDLKVVLTHTSPDCIAISVFTEQELFGRNH